MKSHDAYEVKTEKIFKSHGNLATRINYKEVISRLSQSRISKSNGGTTDDIVVNSTRYADRNSKFCSGATNESSMKKLNDNPLIRFRKWSLRKLKKNEPLFKICVTIYNGPRDFSSYFMDRIVSASRYAYSVWHKWFMQGFVVAANRHNLYSRGGNNRIMQLRDAYQVDITKINTKHSMNMLFKNLRSLTKSQNDRDLSTLSGIVVHSTLEKPKDNTVGSINNEIKTSYSCQVDTTINTLNHPINENIDGDFYDSNSSPKTSVQRCTNQAKVRNERDRNVNDVVQSSKSCSRGLESGRAIEETKVDSKKAKLKDNKLHVCTKQVRRKKRFGFKGRRRLRKSTALITEQRTNNIIYKSYVKSKMFEVATFDGKGTECNSNICNSNYVSSKVAVNEDSLGCGLLHVETYCENEHEEEAQNSIEFRCSNQVKKNLLQSDIKENVSDPSKGNVEVNAESDGFINCKENSDDAAFAEEANVESGIKSIANNGGNIINGDDKDIVDEAESIGYATNVDFKNEKESQRLVPDECCVLVMENDTLNMEINEVDPDECCPPTGETYKLDTIVNENLNNVINIYGNERNERNENLEDATMTNKSDSDNSSNTAEEQRSDCSNDEGTERTIIVPRGFCNPAGYCFLNCVVQVLRGSIEFSRSIAKYYESKIIDNYINESKEKHFVKNFCMLLSVLEEDENIPIEAMLYEMHKYFLESKNGDDVQKCFMAILTAINTVTKVVDNTRCVDDNIEEKSFKNYRNKNQGFIFDLFYGQMSHSLTCLVCKHRINERFQLFKCLPVPVDNSEATVTLSNCIKCFSEPSTVNAEDAMDCTCPGGTKNISSKAEITHAPRYLFIYLTRGSYYVDGRKNNTYVECDSELQLETRHGPVPYRCISTIEHMGDNEGGHYYCKCNYEGERWWLLNDTQVTDLGTEFRGIITRNTNALMFKRTQ